MRSDEANWRDEGERYRKERTAIHNAILAMRGRKASKLRRERWGVGLMGVGSVWGGTCLLTGNYFWAALPVCMIAIGFLLLPNE